MSQARSNLRTALAASISGSTCCARTVIEPSTVEDASIASHHGSRMTCRSHVLFRSRAVGWSPAGAQPGPAGGLTRQTEPDARAVPRRSARTRRNARARHACACGGQSASRTVDTARKVIGEHRRVTTPPPLLGAGPACGDDGLGGGG